MEFITAEVQKEIGLTPEQIEKITPLYSGHIAELQKQWDGKANKDAEGILTGAATSIEKVTGIKRNEGEKIADYYTRSGSEFFKTKETEIGTLKADYEKKLKDFDGSPELKAELEQAKTKLNDLLQKQADYDSIKEKADKYEPLAQNFTRLELEVSFQSAMPTFPETVNPYEAKAKSDECKQNILKEWDVKFIEGQAIGVNKENPYKTEKLKDLILKDVEIAKLMEGRTQQGSNTNPANLQKIEGVPFDVPKGATSSERTTLIRDYLAKQGIGTMHTQYSSKFEELNLKILQKTATTS